MNAAQEFRTFVRTHPTEKRGDSPAQSGSTAVHYGLSNPTMRDFVKEWAKHHPTLSYAAWEQLLSELYAGESVEEHMLAGFMLGQFTVFRQQLPLPVLDGWLGQLEGWREIDTTCQSNFTAAELLAKWEAWRAFLESLATRETIQHRRASLVLLVKPVRESTDARLITLALANVDRLKAERDKLITKAISWVLREGLKRHQATVVTYVEENEHSLPPIAVREFMKKLTTGKK